MACRKCDEIVPPANKEWISGKQQPSATLFGDRGESWLKVTLSA